MSRHAVRPSSPSSTRREFLKKSARTAGVVGALSVAQSAHAAGNEAVRVGLIGCGGRGPQTASRNLLAGPYVKLVALCDVFKERIDDARKRLVERNGAAQVQVDDDHCFVQGPNMDGYKHVIESSDVVMIACASKFHPMYAEAAIKTGKHVFVEKPHGIDPLGVKRMKAVCELAKEKNLSILSGLHSRYDAGWQETMKRIHEGAIGDIVSAQCMFLRAPYVVRTREARFNEIETQFFNWYHFRWLSGDDVPQSLVHNLDRVTWALKEETPTWAFGLAGRSASFGEQYGDMFDHHNVVYEYASGARVYAMSSTQENTYHTFSDIIRGTKGTCYLADYRIEGETKWKYPDKSPDPVNAEQKALVDAVRSGKPINSGYHMINSTMVGVMGQVACYSGQPTKWSQMWNSDMSYGPRPDEVTMKIEPPTKPDATGNYPLLRPGAANILT